MAAEDLLQDEHLEPDVLGDDGYDSDASADDLSHQGSLDSSAVRQDAEEAEARQVAFQQTLLKQLAIEQKAHKTDPAVKRQHQSNNIIDKAREYQQELFERAKEEDIIAVLDTGMGKTLIAAMLIRYILEKEILATAAGGPRKHVFFLANSVPLVHQQARFLTSNLPFAVQPITGDDNIDKWKRDEWLRTLIDQSVIVCTPAVLDQALFHNYVRMDTISLILFDEAHHCKKNHPYSRLIRDYYIRISPDRPRPRLFSMTASPVDSKRDVATTVADLEELLRSKIVTVPDASLVDFAYQPVDEVWQFNQLDQPRATTLWEALVFTVEYVPFIKSEMDVAFQMSSHLGTWFTDRILRHVFGGDESVRIMYGKFERSDKYASMSEEQREAFRNRLFACPNLVRQHAVLALQPQLPAMSPKVQLLYKKLNSTFTADPLARVMVFVEQRWTAVILCDAFRALGIPHLSAGYLTGSGTSGNEVVKAASQEDTMRKFNAGHINILFTTSVGEEGIDIPQCNVVVRFDPNKKTIQYIQSRGRARMRGSIYAHMIEEHNYNQKADMEYFIANAKYLKDFCQRLPPDRLLGKGTKLAQLLAQESSHRSFETSTGAICNFSNCLLVLSRYATSLYHIGATTAEVYEEVIDEAVEDSMYQYTVRVPVIGESTVKGARGEPRPNKILARRSAAFECVVRLRAAQLLDENLDSKFKRERRIEHRMAVSEKKHRYNMVTKPKIWEDSIGNIPDRVFAALVTFTPETPLNNELAPMVLLTRTKLPEIPSFPIYLEGGIRTEVLIKNFAPYPVDEAQMNMVTSFTLRAIFEDVFNKVYEPDASEVSYWLVPSTQNVIEPKMIADIVDFTQLEEALTDRRTWVAGSSRDDWTERFLVDPLSGKHRYITDRVIEGTSIHDPEPQEYLPKEGKKRFATSIINFTDSHWQKSQKDFLAKSRDPAQPVISAELLSIRRNFLDKPTEQEQARHLCWIAPEPLQVGRLSVAVARTAFVWPSIIHRLESYFIVLEGLATIGLGSIPAELALEAHTKDSNTDDQEERTHSTKCRGMGRNYERLEFIGDSLLKMTSTISVYNRTTCKEGDMHDRRKYILCNDTLCNVSTKKLHMYQYIRSLGFDRADWYPEHLVLLAGRGANGKPVKHEAKTHALGNKTIADVSEATIGAAVMTTRDFPLEKRFDLGIQAITTLTDSDDHRINTWSDFAAQHSFQDWQTRTDDPLANTLAATVATKIGYTFTHPRLIRSAFTHPSEMQSPVPDYQRLEFLGDACFDWVAIWWLFSTNPTRNPEWLTEHKMAMVSNQFLSALAVLLSFDMLMFITNVRMKSAISTYAAEVRALRAVDPAPDFWRRLTRSPPKALADLVEATIGAMLVDSNFAFRPIEEFFNTHVRPHFEDIALYDGFANKHPTSLIYKTINGEYGCRRFRVEVRNMQGVKFEDGEEETALVLEEGTEVMATVFVHSSPLGFSQGASARYAKVRACTKALRELEGMGRGEFRVKYGCRCGEVGSEEVVGVMDEV